MKPVLLTVLSLALCACTSAPSQRVLQKLDSRTGATVTVLAHPVELVTDGKMVSVMDPFAFVAPFETDQQGVRTLFLWVTAPPNSGPLATPILLCDGKPVTLTTRSSKLDDVGLSDPPYSLPAPWSVQWYFALSEEGLACLASAQQVQLQTSGSGGQQEHFTGVPQKQGAAFPELAEFAAKRAN